MYFLKPISLFIFNRPTLTKSVFKEIAKVKPRKLFVIADGPRFSDESDKCNEARQVFNEIDWDCELITNFSEQNMGLQRRFITGLEWIFSITDESIILEDDCLPDTSFFVYCAHLLDYYRDTRSISSISGSNFDFRHTNEKHSYRFSRFMNMWGWATWKRGFESIDFDMSFWPAFRRSADFLEAVGGDKEMADYWRTTFDDTYFRNVQSKGKECEEGQWDYRWIVSNLHNRTLSVSPSRNLIKNLGYGSDATHTKYSKDPLSKIDRQEMSFPLVHPSEVTPSEEYERHIKYNWCRIYKPSNPLRRILDLSRS